MNFKKMGKNLIWGVAIIFILWWVWRWVQGQGGILAAFNRFFPGRALLPVVTPPTPTVPVEPTPIPGISPTDRLPWENNRKRSEVINALTADIARIERYPRELANTFTEVVRVGGVDNYLSMQRDRLTRARTFPTFTTRLGVAPITIPAPAPIPLPAYTPAPAPSPLTPVQEITGMPTNGEVHIIQAGAVTRAWGEPTVVYLQE